MRYNRKALDIMFCILLALFVQDGFSYSKHFSGTITENTTFFYRKLPVAPSLRATIEFSVAYNQRSMRDAEHYPLMGIYTTYPEINIAKQCSYIRYGQLRNENLHPYLRVGRYRTTTCEMSELMQDAFDLFCLLVMTHKLYVGGHSRITVLVFFFLMQSSYWSIEFSKWTDSTIIKHYFPHLINVDQYNELQHQLLMGLNVFLIEIKLLKFCTLIIFVLIIFIMNTQKRIWRNIFNFNFTVSQIIFFILLPQQGCVSIICGWLPALLTFWHLYPM